MKYPSFQPLWNAVPFRTRVWFAHSGLLWKKYNFRWNIIKNIILYFPQQILLNSPKSYKQLQATGHLQCHFQKHLYPKRSPEKYTDALLSELSVKTFNFFELNFHFLNCHNSVVMVWLAIGTKSSLVMGRKYFFRIKLPAWLPQTWPQAGGMTSIKNGVEMLVVATNTLREVSMYP